jgi:DNA-binding transcriptional regulator PaaX
MKGHILLKALSLIEDTAMSQVDFFEAVLVSGYGASMNKLDHEYNKIQRKRDKNKITKQELIDRKRKLMVFVSKMKHDGLIEEDKAKDVFLISNKGKQKLTKLKTNLPTRYYEVKKQDSSVIISFDIPERMRRKRDWLREVVKNLGFEMIHRSVWVGKIKIPKEFILDLERMKIIEFVEIFEVSKKGTLEKIGK